MMDWLRGSIKQFPRNANILIFNALTGLRPTEAVESFNLLSSSAEDYLSKGRQKTGTFQISINLYQKNQENIHIDYDKQILDLTKEPKYEELTYSKIRLTFE